MSFTNAPVTRLLVLGLVGSSILASILDIKHYFYILIDTHIWRYRQLWRLLAHQLCYTNSAEVLFGAMTLYNLRAVERMWGTRKYASFLAVTYLLTSAIPPLIMMVLRPLTAGLTNYMPAGPTPVLFAVLAQYHAMVPHMYKYRIATSPADDDGPASGLTLSDKSFRYAIALHLSLLQWPGSLVGALAGWVIGHSWREGLLPAALVRWRLPGWMLGLRATRRHSGEFEGLRRRLEGESSGAAAVATGVEGQQGEGQVEGRRRTMGQQIMAEFREAL
ncbi:DSC E3 ubiquitin ligase complex subunit-like protein [Hapsidospora chrysogenum ATCC 11550]|uniref:DSC E3 ubiquitin ligase complex subunit-like protein n=1 Tax=Hapsidospora chrysogenum (strain ATCC 11550 / CBS 779.69 / DSM 880 / IAM 14645 / JCM 23072 / IMI 49137) TaxID=857340 RepID=A0A086SWY3_HAPC1|nr:DSC E3 ubiquitin ligase complex subunit-like protein [Hapsidospora chrysogenum ATCC 11550]